MYWLPEFVYRRLLSYDVTNWYLLPYSGKIQFGSKGQEGWQQKNLSEKFATAVNLLKNVNINTRPLWRIGQPQGDTIEFELVLFNDTVESAVDNFRFVHTIIPNNMWMQYGIMQHNSSLYDIQFSGGPRYFCCSLDVSCEQVGKSRLPPGGFIAHVVDAGDEGYQLLQQKDILYQINSKLKQLEKTETELKV